MADTFTPLTTPRGTMTDMLLEPHVPICQGDLPLDNYDEAFKPYAVEYLALPDRTPETVLPWLDHYARPAVDHFGNDLLLLAHYYMGGEIVKLVERYGGVVADSYALALAARDRSASVIVESAVHFMAETAAILAHPDQAVWITNPRAGCTMEMMAQSDVVLPVSNQLHQRFGTDLVAMAYMNTSGQLKALAGRTAGAVCTSSNAHLVMQHLLDEHPNAKLLFLPDEHLGRNTAAKLGIAPEHILRLPDAHHLTTDWHIDELDPATLDNARIILWGGWCGVHTIFTTAHVEHWRSLGYGVHVHPECPLDVVEAADGAGSTNYLWQLVANAPTGTKLAIATEGHFVRNAAHAATKRGVTVVHMADVPGAVAPGCGCATMSRNDPPHLAGMLDLLRRGEAPHYHRVLAGDRIDPALGSRTQLPHAQRETLTGEAALALNRMIDITEAAT